MNRAVGGSSSFQSKLEQIRSGATKKTDLGVKENKGVIQGKGGKYAVVEKEKKFEEAGVKRKKRNYVLYESKLGTEKQKDLKKIAEPPKPKPKPKPAQPKPRVEEKIIIKKKRLEYLDNYQYKETKNIKKPKPNQVSIVIHQRLGDIVGGVYEEMTYQKQRMTDSGRGQKLFSQQSTKTTSRRGPQGQTSRTLPAQSREYRKEMRQYSSNTNRRSQSLAQAPAIRGSKTTTTTTTRTTTTRNNSRPTTTNQRTTTTTRKVVTRGQSAGASRGRKY